MGILDWFKRSKPNDVQDQKGVTTTSDLGWKTFFSWLSTNATQITKPYAQSEPYHRAVKAINSIIAAAPLKVYKWKGDVLEEVDNHPLVDLLDYVNPEMDKFQLIEATIIHLFEGDCFWYLVPSVTGRGIAMIIPFSKRYFEIGKRDALGFPLSWKLRVNDMEREIDAKYIVHFKFYNPYDAIFGLGEETVTKYSYEQEFWMAVWNKTIFENDSIPAGLFKTTFNLSDAQAERLIETFEERHKGYTRKGNIGVLPPGVEFQSIQQTPKELEFVESRRELRRNILGTMGVPPIFAGDYERATYNNTREQIKLLTHYVCIPIMNYIERKLKSDLTDVHFSDVEIKFDRAGLDIFKEEFESKLDRALKLKQIGYSGRQINRILNLADEDPEAELVPMTVIPIEDIIGIGQKVQEAVQQAIAPIIKTDKTFDLRAEYWRNYSIKAFDAREQRWQRFMKNYFYEKRKETLDILYSRKTADLPPDVVQRLLLIWDEDLQDFIEATQKQYAAVMRESGEEWAYILGVSFNIHDPKVTQWILTNARKYAADITVTMKRRIKQIIAEGEEQGWSIDAIANRLRDEFKFALHRTRTQARTEVVSASNHAAVVTAENAGMQKKQWITAADERVRETHQQAEGEQVDIKMPFTATGEPLMYPGDKNGSPGNIINCRCTVIFLE